MLLLNNTGTTSLISSCCEKNDKELSIILHKPKQSQTILINLNMDDHFLCIEDMKIDLIRGRIFVDSGVDNVLEQTLLGLCVCVLWIQNSINTEKGTLNSSRNYYQNINTLSFK